MQKESTFIQLVFGLAAKAGWVGVDLWCRRKKNANHTLWTNACHCVCCDPRALSPHIHSWAVIEQLWSLIFSLFSAQLYMTAGLCKGPHWTPNSCPLRPCYLLKDLASFTHSSCPCHLQVYSMAFWNKCNGCLRKSSCVSFYTLSKS